MSEPTDRDLVLERIIDAPPAKVYRAWTEPALLMRWFAPLPYTTPVAELDVRPGGSSLIVMRGPDGQDRDIVILCLSPIFDWKSALFGWPGTGEYGHEELCVEEIPTEACDCRSQQCCKQIA